MKKIVVLGGGRMPFHKSSTIYKNLSNLDLLSHSFNGIFEKIKIEKNKIDYILTGNVIQDVSTANVARETAINCNIPTNIPAVTVSQACISSGQCVSLAGDLIKSGQCGTVLVGGVESFSDVPIKYSKPMRQWLMELPKKQKKGIVESLNHLSKLKLSYLKPEAPKLQNYNTGLLMGEASEQISKMFGISRLEQDNYTVRSHNLAWDAHKQGLYSTQIYPFKDEIFENNIKKDLKLSDIRNLKPSFIKHGTHTAANSTGLTDGSASCLLSSIDKAKDLNIEPLAIIEDTVTIATDPYNEMLLGPAYAIPKLLKKNNLQLRDIGVFEIHEAFSGQILANLTALNNENFCKKKLDADKIGEIPIEKLNLWGGSIAIGHPLAASNIRNIMTAIYRMKKENSEFALVSACADSGLGISILLRNI